MSQQSEALKERSMLFAVNILRLLDRFPRTVAADVIAKQLAKMRRQSPPLSRRLHRSFSARLYCEARYRRRGGR